VSRESEVKQWRKPLGRFKMQALTSCDANITSTTSTQTATGQFKGQFQGAKEEMSQNVQNASSHPINLRTHKAHS